MQTELNDLIFWATSFWQEEKQKENKKDAPEYFLPAEGANAIADSLTALGHDVSPADVAAVYTQRR